MKKIIGVLVLLICIIGISSGVFYYINSKEDAKQMAYGKEIRPEVLTYLKKEGYDSSDIVKSEIQIDKKMNDKHAVRIAIIFADDKNHVYYYFKDKKGNIYQNGATGEKHYEE
ncbi:DUF3139 domain-containing protein [Heyndrickxia camelliae]|uniref:DUF3139 domain-containing protein n=1 Tax=Heyndrickxia camelliae TaxID=1707093 RepID=A0A2N3LKQ8_9BACI|nr:DUF3139 domain-containing protein [Heyndrickxia camelliae]PKR85232.1 hypothetical protein CWO92_10800 [Heyndrickxia camelliae]